jgi:hypothetical protein
MKTFTKHLVQASLLAVASLCATGAMAHGPAKAEHGGIVKSAHDLSFELVTEVDAVKIYVVDHDDAKSTAGATGKLTVLHGKDKKEYDLVPAARNAVEAKGAKVVKGDTAAASINFGDKESVTVRFKVR